jgi:hAT family C-terminal dimerisation region
MLQSVGVLNKSVQVAVRAKNLSITLTVHWRLGNMIPLSGGGYVIRYFEIQSTIYHLLKHHQTQFPTLARIARDYLAIQGSSVPSERAFSSGGLTDTKFRNRLKPETFEALQILKCCYRDRLIVAEDEAAAHDHVWVPMES